MTNAAASRAKPSLEAFSDLSFVICHLSFFIAW
jgi:hypothetical protein